MPTRPRDVADLYLAPVAIALDQELAMYDGLSEHDIEYRVALVINDQPRNAAERPDSVLRALTRTVETHGWEIDWASRGLQISHDEHQLTLGIPGSLRDYLRLDSAGSPQARVGDARAGDISKTAT